MKKRVLQISNYYTPHIGGIEQTCQYLSEGLKDEYEVKVICFSEDKETKVQEGKICLFHIGAIYIRLLKRGSRM